MYATHQATIKQGVRWQVIGAAVLFHTVDLVRGVVDFELVPQHLLGLLEHGVIGDGAVHEEVRAECRRPDGDVPHVETMGEMNDGRGLQRNAHGRQRGAR